MNKFKMLTIMGLCGLTLVACGENKSSDEKSKPKESIVEESSMIVDQSSETVDSEVIEESNQNDPTELPQSFTTNGAEYNIKEINIGTGSMTNEPIIFITMEFTNLNSQPQSPYMQFVVDFDVQQTDGTTTDSLMGANGELGNIENQESVEMGDSQVNPNSKVDAIIGYKLKYENEPIQFVYRPSQMTGNPQGILFENK